MLKAILLFIINNNMFFVVLDIFILTGLTMFFKTILGINKINEKFLGKISHNLTRSAACLYFSVVGTKLWLTCTYGNLTDRELIKITYLSHAMITYFIWDMVISFYQYTYYKILPRIDLTIHHSIALVGFYLINTIYKDFIYLTIFGAMAELMSTFSGIKLLANKLASGEEVLDDQVWAGLEKQLIRSRLFVIVFWRIPVWFSCFLTVYKNTNNTIAFIITLSLVSSIMILEFKWFKSGIKQLLRC